MRREPTNSMANPLWALSGLGAELFGGIAGMGLLGWAIDRFVVGSGTTWLLVCLIVGIIGGGANFIRQALALNRKAAAEYKRDSRARPTASVPPPERVRRGEGGSTPGSGWFQSEVEPEDEDEKP